MKLVQVESIHIVVECEQCSKQFDILKEDVSVNDNGDYECSITCECGNRATMIEGIIGGNFLANQNELSSEQLKDGFANKQIHLGFAIMIIGSILAIAIGFFSKGLVIPLGLAIAIVGTSLIVGFALIISSKTNVKKSYKQDASSREKVVHNKNQTININERFDHKYQIIKKVNHSHYEKCAGIVYTLGAFFIYKGFEKITNYSNSSSPFSSSNVNAYVGGDAYNYIINANYAVCFFILALICAVIASTALILGKMNPETEHQKNCSKENNPEAN